MTVLGDVQKVRVAAQKVKAQVQLRRLLLGVATADLLVLSAAVMLAWVFRVAATFGTTGVGADGLPAVAGPWIVLLWMVFLAAQGTYSPRVFGAGPDEFKRVSMASVLSAGCVGMALYLLNLDPSRGFVLLSFVIGAPLLLLERYAARKALHHLRHAGRLQHRVVVVGGPSAVNEIVDVLARERYLGYHVLGACVPDQARSAAGAVTVPLLGSVEETREVCDEVGADTVLVARGAASSSHDLRRIAWDLEESDIDLVVVPSLTDVAGPRMHMRPVAGLPLLHVEGPQADEAGGLVKRTFDVLVAGLTVAVISPLMLAVAVLIKLEDGGPVFFRQTRVGRGGEPFAMVKFRSMAVDAERRLDDVRHLNESAGVLFKVRRDPRVTRVGRFLRKYSIDELPQLFNVLTGRMSLVGPRPPLPTEVALYEDDVHRRLLVRPGMTGLWQVSGRSRLSWEESVRLDLYYVDNWSMVSDVVIMAKTVKAVLGSSGAY